MRLPNADEVVLQKVKILHTITGLHTGGAEMMLYRLLSQLNRARFDSTVVSLTDWGPIGDRIEALGVKVHVAGLRSVIRVPDGLWRLSKLVKRLRPDIIQGWMYHGNLVAQILSLFLRGTKPVIWNIRHTPSHLRNEKWQTAILIRLGAMLSNRPVRIIYNARVSAAFHENLGYKVDKRVIIPNGFDTQQFHPSERARREIRRELGLSTSTFLIGLIARYHPMKDHATFLRAATQLLQTSPEVHLLLVGRGVDRNNSGLSLLIRQLGLTQHVDLLGERADMPTVMAALDIATSCSAYGEGFSNVIGEAMACGVPCVVTDVGDSAFLVGDTGRVVSTRDPESLVSGWRQLLGLSEESRRALGIAARRRIQEHFGLPTIAKKYAELYEEVAMNNRNY